MRTKPLLAIVALTISLGGILQADPGDRTRLGAEGVWKGTLAGTVLADWIYTAEKNGGLYRTNPHTGEWAQIGDLEFAETRHIFALNGWLYTIESDGSLYRVSPTDGRWKRIGDQGGWANTLAGIAYPIDEKKGHLVTIESNGGLYITDPSQLLRLQIGKSEFQDTQFMFLGDDSWLYTIESDGSLYKVDPVEGSWKRMGKPGDWRNTLAGAQLNHYLYTAETSGALYRTNLVTGQWTRLQREGFEKTAFMFAALKAIYTIDTDGSLDGIDVGAAAAPEVAEKTSTPPLPETPKSEPPTDPAPAISRTKIRLKPLVAGRLQVEVVYAIADGTEHSETFEGTKGETKAWLRSLPDLPEKRIGSSGK